jgi:hypothetical protein
MPEPRKPGRPALPVNERRRKHIHLALTDAELRAAKAQARAAKKALPGWMRDLIVADIQKATP